MSNLYVADYSFQPPTARQLTSPPSPFPPFTGVVGYLSPTPPKNLTLAQARAYWAAGLYVGLVFESTSNRPLQGYEAGLSDALLSQRQADALSWGPRVAIPYACDFYPDPSELPAVIDYYRGVINGSQGRRPPGAYGSYPVIELLANHPELNGLVCFWQSAGGSGRGEGTGGSIHVPNYGYDVRLSTHSCMFQYPSPDAPIPGTDLNLLTKPLAHALFLYHPDNPLPPIDPLDPDSETGDDDLSQEQMDLIRDWIADSRAYTSFPTSLVGLADGGVYAVTYIPGVGACKSHISTSTEVEALQAIGLYPDVLYVEMGGPFPITNVNLPLSPERAAWVNNLPAPPPPASISAPSLSPETIADLARTIADEVGDVLAEHVNNAPGGILTDDQLTDIVTAAGNIATRQVTEVIAARVNTPTATEIPDHP